MVPGMGKNLLQLCQEWTKTYFSFARKEEKNPKLMAYV